MLSEQYAQTVAFVFRTGACPDPGKGKANKCLLHMSYA